MAAEVIDAGFRRQTLGKPGDDAGFEPRNRSAPSIEIEFLEVAEIQENPVPALFPETGGQMEFGLDEQPLVRIEAERGLDSSGRGSGGRLGERLGGGRQ
jgi:hypothetical protein